MNALKILGLPFIPANLILILLVTGLFFLWKQRLRPAKILLTAAGLLYYLFSFRPFSDLLIFPLESPYRKIPPPPETVKTVVLLLGGKEGDILRASKAVALYHHRRSQGQRLAIIVSGSYPLNPETSEASWVREHLKDEGVLQEDIALEARSRNTKESALYLKPFLHEKPFLLVTSAYHMTRSLRVFRTLGMNPIPLPADFKTGDPFNVLDLLPSASQLRNCDAAMHEYMGLAYHALIH